jgi:hypothetical protein
MPETLIGIGVLGWMGIVFAAGLILGFAAGCVLFIRVLTHGIVHEGWQFLYKDGKPILL